VIEGIKHAGDGPPLPVELVGGTAVGTARLVTDAGGEFFAVVIANRGRSMALYWNRNERCFEFIDL